MLGFNREFAVHV